MFCGFIGQVFRVAVSIEKGANYTGERAVPKVRARCTPRANRVAGHPEGDLPVAVAKLIER